MLQFLESDGGRSEAGYKGSAGDCGVRAAAIATRKPYAVVYDDLHARQKAFKAGSRKSQVKSRSASPRNGVWKEVMHQYMSDHGADWIPLAHIGGEVIRVKDVAAHWPDRRIVLRLARHYSAMDCGVNMDTWEQHPEKRVYGAWVMPNA